MGKRGYYKGLLLREFYFSGKLSCADLSERIGKSIPLTMKILNELMAEGYVTESGYAPSSGGRRPIMYSIRPDTIYILSVAMDQLVTRISLMDIENQHVLPIEKFELPLPKNPRAIHILADKMAEVIHRSGIDKKKIVGAGIGMPGFIDFKKGINYSYMETEDKTITQFLSDKLSMPVYIDNDSSLIALAEFRFGAARHKKNAMVINISWGIGLGMILNGELFRGHNGFAGEFSHIPLFNNNKLCGCGKSGCLETEASLQVVIEKAAKGLKEGRISALGNEFPSGHAEQDWETLVSAALKGDRFVVELLSDTGYDIGKAVAILIHLVNPETVILSGRGTLAGKVWQAPIQQALNEHSIPRLAANTTLAISTLGYQSELIGSAALVMENRVREQAKPLMLGKQKDALAPEVN
ncbi:MAG TPA: ROK family protein [Chitinophagaceae bacterium]|nr:ROK family protein [Chitinophagaceae bacterium]